MGFLAIEFAISKDQSRWYQIKFAAINEGFS